MEWARNNPQVLEEYFFTIKIIGSISKAKIFKLHTIFLENNLF